MTNAPRTPSRGALRRMFGKLVLTTLGISAAPVVAEATDPDEVEAALRVVSSDDPDGAASGQALAQLLGRMHPLDATRTAATAAMSPRPELRVALGEALTWHFRLIGDSVVIDHLSQDREPGVRFAAARAAHARRTSGGDAGVLDRLSHDPDPGVREAAILALHGR